MKQQIAMVAVACSHYIPVAESVAKADIAYTIGPGAVLPERMVREQDASRRHHAGQFLCGGQHIDPTPPTGTYYGYSHLSNLHTHYTATISFWWLPLWWPRRLIQLPIHQWALQQIGGKRPSR